MNWDIEGLQPFCGRLCLLQVRDCRGGWHLEQNTGSNSVGEVPQNCDRENQLIGGTQTWQLSVSPVSMSLLLIVPFSEIESCGVIPSFYITMRKPKTFQGYSLMYSIKKSHVFCFGQTGLILVGQLSRIGGMGGGGGVPTTPPPCFGYAPGTAGEGGSYLFLSFLPLPLASQTFRHQLDYCCRELTSAHS